MKDLVLYAYSSDNLLKEWLSFLLEEVEADISICSNFKKLEKLYAERVPDIMLIDDNSDALEDDEEGISIIEVLKQITNLKKKTTSTIVVLSKHASEIEYKVNFLLNGADYLIEKPLSMVELIARITAMLRHQRHIQERISEYVHQTKDISTFDAMDRITVYLDEHIKPIIEKQMASAKVLKSNNIEEKNEFIRHAMDDAIKMLASIRAIKDNVHDLLTAKTVKTGKGYDKLNNLFKKNLELINIAYDGFIGQQNP